MKSQLPKKPLKKQSNNQLRKKFKLRRLKKKLPMLKRARMPAMKLNQKAKKMFELATSKEEAREVEEREEAVEKTEAEVKEEDEVNSEVEESTEPEASSEAEVREAEVAEVEVDSTDLERTMTASPSLKRTTMTTELEVVVEEAEVNEEVAKEANSVEETKLVLVAPQEEAPDQREKK